MKYEIDQEYTDDSWNNLEEEDELLTVINNNIDHGIRNKGGIRLVNADDGKGGSGQTKFIILVDNPREDGQYINDVVYERGEIAYKGDNKPSKDKEKVKNPAVVEAIKEYSAESEEKRSEAPPVLYFRTKPDEATKIVFKGLCQVEKSKDIPVRDETGFAYNKEFTLKILNTLEVDTRWIEDFVKNDSHEHAPEVWKTWVKTGKADRLMPDKDYTEKKLDESKEKLIEEVKTRIEDEDGFEKLVVKLFNDANFNLTKTRSNSDGGYDAYGTREGRYFTKTVKVEAKFYQKDNRVGRETGVFNLDRGDEGYFVTTTGFTESAKDRINHPDMKFVDKEKLANMLIESSLTKGFHLKKEVVQEVNAANKKKTSISLQ